MHSQQVTYQGQTLVKRANLGSGKNAAQDDQKQTWSGFYKDEKSSNEFVIKTPKNKVEFAIELFAGAVLQSFIDHKIFSKQADLVVAASLIELPDGKGYGLIQPKVQGSSLTALIHEAKEDKTPARNPIEDTLHGTKTYPAALNKIKHKGLAFSLVMPYIFSAYSTHSDNMFLREPSASSEEMDGSYVIVEEKAVVRIDWGDAFRNYLLEKNNEDIQFPVEYQGTGFFKLFTKNYMRFYMSIPDLFDKDIPREAKIIQENIQENKIDLTTIIDNALASIPKEIMDEETAKGFFQTLGGPIDHYDAKVRQEKAKQIADVMNLRIQKNLRLY